MSFANASLAAPGAPPRVPRTGPWVAGGAAAVALLLVAGWLLVVSPQRSTLADLRDQTAYAQADAETLTTRVAVLKQQYADLPEYVDRLEALRVALPTDAALPALVRSVRAAALSSDVQLTSLVPSAPTALAGTAPDAAAASTAAPDAAAGATAAPDASATADGTAPAAATPAAAVPGAGVLSVPLTITATGSYAELQVFLATLQGSDRLYLVGATELVPSGTADDGATRLTLTVSGSVFALPAQTQTQTQTPTSAG